MRGLLREMKPPKPYNNHTWTAAKFRQFIINQMRRASMRWQPKRDAIKAAFVERGPNPDTGRMCKLHRCPLCGELFPQNKMHADHIDPVIDPAAGFTTWDEYVKRMFVEVEGYQAICTGCHKEKIGEERAVRTEANRERKAQVNTAVRKRTRRTPTTRG